MAGIRFRASSGEEAIVAATAETVLQIVAAANHRVKITEYTISVKGLVVTDGPIFCQIRKQTTAGTSSAGTMVKEDTSVDETLQTTNRIDVTVEPTDSDIIDEFEVHPQTGVKVFLPLGQEIIVAGGGRIGFKLNAPQNQTVVVSVAGEE